MSADLRFWLYLGFFLYTVYCLLTIEPDEEESMLGSIILASVGALALLLIAVVGSKMSSHR